MTAVGYHCQCCSVSADYGSKGGCAFVARTYLGQPLSGRNQQPSGKKRAAPRKRVCLRGLRVQSRAGSGRGALKVKDKDIEDQVEPNAEGGTKKLQKLPGTLKLQGTGQRRPKDNKVVFVAGATGKVGSRTVRELLKLGFSVRACTRNVEKAEALLGDVLQKVSNDEESKPSTPFGIFSPAKLFGFLNPRQGKSVEIVACDLEDPETIEPALGNAGVVVCCIGASEKEVLDVSGPYRIDYKATQNLIDAATAAEVNHFVLLTSLGTQKFGFPAAVLNLFWGVLIWKAKAERALVQSGIPYTIVRPGGMERPTDAYKETHNLVLSEADTLFGGQISNLQVAELIASIVANPQSSKNKILEAIAETTAPLRPIEELLEEIPGNEDKIPISQLQGTQKVRSGGVDIAAQRLLKKQEEENAAEEKRKKAEKEEEERRKIGALRAKYEKEILVAKEKEEEAKNAAEAALAEKAELERKAAELRLKAEAAALAARQAKALEAATLSAARQGQVLSEQEKQKVLESVKLDTQQKIRSPEEPIFRSKKTPSFALFGGGFPFQKVAEVEPESKDTSFKDTPQSSGVQLTSKSSENGKKQKQAEIKAKAKAEQDAKLVKEKELEAKEKAELEAKILAEQEAVRVAEAMKREEQQEVEAKILAEKAVEKPKDKITAAEQETAEKPGEKVELKEEEDAKSSLAKQKDEIAAEQVTITEETEPEKLDAKDAEIINAENVLRDKASDSAPISAARKGFRWFWQPAEPAAPETEPTDSDLSATVSVKEAADLSPETKKMELPLSSTPLSPYSRFPGVKPPSPILSPPAVTEKSETVPTVKAEPQISETKKSETVLGNEVMAEEDEVAVTEGLDEEWAKEVESCRRLVVEAAAREKEALEKAKSVTAFFWPWQKPETVPEPAKPATPSGDEKAEDVPSLSPSEKVGNGKALPASSRPLSPYTIFPELKPPSSPSPSPATVPKAETFITSTDPQNSGDELQRSKDIKAEKEDIAGVNEELEKEAEARKVLAAETAAREREALEKAKSATSIPWPWKKPETVEEPIEPLASIILEQEPDMSTSDQTKSHVPQSLPASSRPLSPYALFPDLKPPPPPMPSVSQSSSASEQISVEAQVSDNGAVLEEPTKAEEKIPEPLLTSGFRWPWQ